MIRPARRPGRPCRPGGLLASTLALHDTTVPEHTSLSLTAAAGPATATSSGDIN